MQTCKLVDQPYSDTTPYSECSLLWFPTTCKSQQKHFRVLDLIVSYLDWMTLNFDETQADPKGYKLYLQALN